MQSMRSTPHHQGNGQNKELQPSQAIKMLTAFGLGRRIDQREAAALAQRAFSPQPLLQLIINLCDLNNSTT